MDLRSSRQKTIQKAIKEIDAQLSQRFIALDPSGYFLIRIESSSQEIVVEHYSNKIDDIGRAIDPNTGEVLGCEGGQKRKAIAIYRGRSAKEVGILLTEGNSPLPISRLDHALYLGRELQKAETCLIKGASFSQD